jgi:hypothetical protein
MRWLMKFDQRGKTRVLPRWQRIQLLWSASQRGYFNNSRDDAKTLAKWVIWPVREHEHD